MREVRLAASHRRVGRPATVAWAGHAPTGGQATRQPGGRPPARDGPYYIRSSRPWHASSVLY